MCTCVHCAGFVCGCAYSNVYVRRTHAENVPSTRVEMMPSYDMSYVAGRGELVLGGQSCFDHPTKDRPLSH